MELSKRTFGLEFEIVNEHSWEYYSRRVEQALRSFPGAAEFNPTGEYGHSDGKRWEFKSDSSCGWELVTPAMTWKDWSQVEAVLRNLSHTAKVNENCGLHVHHDIRDFRHKHLRRLVLIWMLFEDMMFASMQPNRTGNRFCQELKHMDLNPAVFEWQSRRFNNLQNSTENFGHYYALNTQRYWNLGLVEFRLHHGTLNAEETKRWVLLTQSLCEMAKLRPWGKVFLKENEADVPRKLRLFQRAISKYMKHPEIVKAAGELRDRVRQYHPALLNG